MTKGTVPVRKSTKAEGNVSDNPQTVSTKKIKAFVSSHFPPEHPLRQVILAEREILTPEEFLSKSEIR